MLSRLWCLLTLMLMYASSISDTIVAGLVMTGGPIAVVGPTGKLGRTAVQLLSERGIATRILCRHVPSSKVSIEPPSAAASSADVIAYLSSLPNVELVRGDLSDVSSLTHLLDGCTACLALHGAVRTVKPTDLLPWVDESLEASHARQVNFVGVRNILAAAQASQTCRRVVRITGKGESPWSIFTILINSLGSMAKAWNYAGETVLRDPTDAGDIEYTIIRPGVMDSSPVAQRALALADNGGDLKVSPISYAAIAELCVDCLSCPNAAGATLTAMTVTEGQGQDSWHPLLKVVAADTRTFPDRDTLVSEHYRAVRTVSSVIFAALLLLATTVSVIF